MNTEFKSNLEKNAEFSKISTYYDNNNENDYIKVGENTELYRIRDTKEHYEYFKEIFTDPEIMKTTMSFEGKPAPKTKKKLKPIFDEWVECNEIFNHPLSVLVFKNKEFAGLFLVRKYPKEDNSKKPKEVEVGHFYKKKFHGTSIAIIILKYISNTLFVSCKVDSILGKIKSDNLSAQAVAIRCGGKFRNSIIKKKNLIINIYTAEKKNYSNKNKRMSDIDMSIREYINASSSN